MIRSFLTITLRVLWRNKVTTLINIFSLTIGITAFILILLYVHHETNYDKFNDYYDRIYRLEGDDYGKLPPIVGQYVKNNLPEVENIARLSVGVERNIQFKPENDPENQKEIIVNSPWADSTTCKVFTFHFIQGDPETALVDPFTIVLSKLLDTSRIKECRSLFDEHRDGMEMLRYEK
jgi:putative ABC transport system permease protein